jgi:hypothetical protein
VSNETRSAAILRLTLAAYAAGTSLPDTRRAVAAVLGGTPASFLGTVDPVYYRATGLDTPIVLPASKPATTKDGKVSAAFRVALRKRRDSGVRWNVLAASAEATLGRRVSIDEAKRLYALGGGDLDTSYAGRGTKVGAPGVYDDPAEAVRGGEAS